jgi:hypothetical protein
MTSVLVSAVTAEPTPTPTCQGEPATIVATGTGPVVGTNGPDVIVGTTGADTIDGSRRRRTHLRSPRRGD